MADIDQIIAGGSGASSRADFSGLAGIADTFYKARDQKYQQEGRDLFKGGLPTTADGQPDFAAIGKSLFQHGDIGQGIAAANLDLNRQKLKYGMEAGASDFPSSAPAPLVSPPSINRSAQATVAPPLNRGGEVKMQGGGDAPGSIVGIVSAGGVPDELAGPIIAQISAMTKLDPNAAVDPKMAPRVQEVAQAVIGRLKAGNAAPQPAAQPAAPPATDPTLGGIVPAGRSPQQQLDLMTRRVASGLLTPEQAKVYETRIKAIQDHLAPTPDMKNAAASGQSLTDYQNRGDENKAQTEILKGSILPKLDESQKVASAAREEISAIHRSREQLDQPGGIFNGAVADTRLKLAKVADFMGVPNTDKIANTEAFGAAIGGRVLSLVKGLGAGAGISNADRDFAAGMAGGSIKLDEKSIRRILDIGEQAARGKIDLHNENVGKIIKSNEALKGYSDVYRVDAPGGYKKADAPAYKDGQRAFNKQTGQSIVFQGGKWTPVQ